MIYVIVYILHIYIITHLYMYNSGTNDIIELLEMILYIYIYINMYIYTHIHKYIHTNNDICIYSIYRTYHYIDN